MKEKGWDIARSKGRRWGYAGYTCNIFQLSMSSQPNENHDLIYEQNTTCKPRE